MTKFLGICLVIFSGLSSLSSAEEVCGGAYWSPRGTIGTEALAYDHFLASLPEGAARVMALNEYIRKHGLLMQLKSTSDVVQGYDNYLLAEGVSGFNVGLFLKYLRVMAFANVTFDSVVEVNSPDSKQVKAKWNLPFGGHGPVAIRADSILYRESLTSICSGANAGFVTLAVSREGIYRAVEEDKFPDAVPIVDEKCNSQRTFFKLSTTAKCAEFKDLRSNKMRILVWDARIK